MAICYQRIFLCSPICVSLRTKYIKIICNHMKNIRNFCSTFGYKMK